MVLLLKREIDAWIDIMQGTFFGGGPRETEAAFAPLTVLCRRALNPGSVSRARISPVLSYQTSRFCSMGFSTVFVAYGNLEK